MVTEENSHLGAQEPKGAYRRVLFVVALLLLTAFIGPARAGLFSDSWHYKITVTIDTPEGPKSGSTVREVILGGKGFSPSPEMGRHREVRGEAVAIDLGSKGYLFSTVGGDNGYRRFFELFPGPIREGKKILPTAKYPEFVRFSNLENPQTVQRVCNPERCEKLRRALKSAIIPSFIEAFGEGFLVKEISIEVTNDPVTWGIEKLLPWLPQRLLHDGTYLGAAPETCCGDPSGTLEQASSFSKGGY